MFSIAKPADNRVDIHIQGPIDADQMRSGLDALTQAAEGVENGTMLYTIDDFPWPTAGAIAVEMGRLPQLFSLVANFRRCAVVTDAGWMRTAAEWEGALIPGLEIKGFAANERAVAQVWLGE